MGCMSFVHADRKDGDTDERDQDPDEAPETPPDEPRPPDIEEPPAVPGDRGPYVVGPGPSLRTFWGGGIDGKAPRH